MIWSRRYFGLVGIYFVQDISYYNLNRLKVFFPERMFEF